ncbi:hypothetical protein NW759_013487 [Fusarium solani]|nr:hypothetical protein NW759_013487 [Fusarium solani]
MLTPCAEPLEATSQLQHPDHLNRHQVSHGDERPFHCDFCSLSFRRRDALLRHWRTCEPRLEAGAAAPPLETRQRGRKQNACNRCAQLKKKCTGSFPCDSCSATGRECSYLRPPRRKSASTADADHTSSAMLSQMGGLEDLVRGIDPFGDFLGEQLSLRNLLPAGLDECSAAPSPTLTRVRQDEHGGDVSCSLPDSLPILTSLAVSEHSPQIQDIPWAAADMFSFIPSLSGISTWRFAFLSRFTSTHGMADSFDCGDADLRRHVLGVLAPQLHLPTLTAHDSTVPCSRPAPSWTNTGQTFNLESPAGLDSQCQNTIRALLLRLDSLDGEIAVPGGYPDSELVAHHPLEAKSCEIVLGIKNTLCAEIRGSLNAPVWTQARENACYRFFSPRNLERFMTTFWSFWYPNWPVFHKPTFSISQKSAQLVASLSLISACLTSDESDRSQALMWLAVVEKWVFSHPDFSERPIHLQDDDNHARYANVESRLDALRAAYAVVLLLSWEGSGDQTCRGRRNRFAQVVWVARSLNQAAAAPQSFDRSTSMVQIKSWRDFALKEECIRTLMYVFLLDCGYVMFNNTPPRMVISELQFGLACPESCFKATKLDVWLASMSTYLQSQSTYGAMRLSDAIDTMLKAELTAKEAGLFQHTNLVNLFTIASAFHNLIFHHSTGPARQLNNPYLSCGLRNWIRAWDTRVLTPDDVDTAQPDVFDWWRRIGFMKYAPEFWRLAVVVFKVSRDGQQAIVHGNQGFGGVRRASLFKEFDSSNMQQVNELITQYQDLNVQDAHVLDLE